MKNVPELRFDGFDGEWDYKTFGEIIERKSKSSTKNSLPRVEYEDIHSDLGRLNKDISSKSSNKKGIHFESNDVLFGKLRPYLKNYLNPQFEGIAVGDFWILNNSSGHNSFLFYHIQTPKFQYVANTSIGTKMPRSDWNLVAESKFLYPSKKEQEKIGDLFSKIDALIEKQEAKVSKMEDLKKSMLQKMFPKKGELVPEFRFEGFDENWTKGTLNDLGTVSMNRRIFKDQTSKNGDVPFYKIGTFGKEADSYISKELFNEYKSKYPYPTIGDLLISASGSIGKVIEYTGEDAYYQDSNIVWLKTNEKIKNIFLKQYYYTLNWRDLEGSTIKRLYNKDILRQKICYPDIEEQQKIGQFFKNLDDQIESEQRLLDSYKLMKKSLLQKMFV